MTDSRINFSLIIAFGAVLVGIVFQSIAFKSVWHEFSRVRILSETKSWEIGPSVRCFNILNVHTCAELKTDEAKRDFGFDTKNTVVAIVLTFVLGGLSLVLIGLGFALNLLIKRSKYLVVGGAAAATGAALLNLLALILWFVEMPESIRNNGSPTAGVVLHVLALFAFLIGDAFCVSDSSK